MGNKNTVKPKTFITAGDMGANYASDSFDISEMDNLAIQLTWTGTPTGTIQVQGTIKDSPGTDDWVDVLTTGVSTAGAAGTALINLSNVAWTDVRVYYTRSSGSGALSGLYFAKAV